jgi:iron complex outermembrane receptor protein
MPNWCFLDDGHPDWDPACEQTNESDYSQFSVNLNWQINQAWSFASITGISDFSSEGRTDWVMVGTRVDPTNVESDVMYQEFQLTADFGRVDFVTGVSFFDEDSSSIGAVLERRGTSVYNGTGGTPGVPPDAVAMSTFRPDGLFVTTDTTIDQATMSYGVFANLAWHLTDRFTVTPGVRYGYDEKEVTQVRRAADDFVPFAGSSTEVFAEDDWNDTDYRLTLDYQISPNHMVYLTSSKAYRAGAYSYNIVGAPVPPAIGDTSGAAQTAAIAAGTVAAFTPPESVENNELGFRTEWLNQRLRLNITYFDMAYSDRQGPIQVSDPSQPTGFRIQTVDTGDVDLDGIEIEGQIAATERFTLDFSAGSIDSLVKDQCANNGEFLFPGPVEDGYTLGGRWSMPMQRGSNLTVMLSYAYTGPQQTHPGGTNPTNLACTNPITGAPNPLPNSFQDSRYELPDYALLNGRVRYTSTDGNWALTFFGNNLTDEVYGNYATRFGGGFWDSAIPAGVAVPQRSALGLTMGRPREYGITFDYNFGNRPQAE